MKKIFYFILFFLPFQVYFNLFPGIDLASGRVLILLLSIFIIASLLIKKRLSFNFSLPDFFVITALFFILLSFGVSDNLAWSSRKMLFLLSFLPIYFMARHFLKSQKDLEKAFSLVIISSLIIAILGVAQFFGQFIFGQEVVYSFWSHFIAPHFFGISFSNSVLANPSWLVSVLGKTLLRATATFPDPHMLSFFLNLALGLNLTLILIKKRPLFFWVSTFLFIFLADLLTFSRGGYLGLFVSLVIVAVIFFSRTRIIGRLASFSLLLMVVLCLVVPSFFSQRFFSSFDLQEGSNIGRIETWKKSWSVLSEHPLTGVGVGSYPLHIKANADYREPIYAHSNYLDIWLDGGLGAFLSWIGLLILSWVIFIKKFSQDFFFLGPLFSLIAFSVHSLFETSIYSISVFPLFLVIISLASFKCSSIKNETV